MGSRPRTPVTRSVTIKCAIYTVFGFLSRLDTLPAWDSEVLRVERRSAGPIGLGTRFDQTVAHSGEISCYASMVIAFEPPYQLAWLSERAGEPDGERESTRITLEAAGDATVVHIRRLTASHRGGGGTSRDDPSVELTQLEAALQRLHELLEGEEGGHQRCDRLR